MTILHIHQGAKFPVARSLLATKYFSLATGIWSFFSSKLDLREKKWRPNSLIWLLDSDLKFRALIYTHVYKLYITDAVHWLVK
jgi:hypothetical protein